MANLPLTVLPIHTNGFLAEYHSEATEPVGSTNDSGNALQYTLPAGDFSIAQLIKVYLEIHSAATYHALDQDHSIEVLIDRNGVTIERASAPERFHARFSSASPGAKDTNHIAFINPLNTLLYPNDFLTIYVPPADNHATAATGVYRIQFNFRIIEW